MGERSHPRNHPPASPSNLPRSPTRLPTRRPSKRTNASVSAASVKKPRKRRPGRRNANAGSRPSKRPKPLSSRRSRSTWSARKYCESSSTRSRRRSGPRIRNGGRRKAAERPPSASLGLREKARQGLIYYRIFCPKNLRGPLETFSWISNSIGVAMRRSGCRQGPATDTGTGKRPVPPVTILLPGGSGYAHCRFFAPVPVGHRV